MLFKKNFVLFNIFCHFGKKHLFLTINSYVTFKLILIMFSICCVANNKLNATFNTLLKLKVNSYTEHKTKECVRQQVDSLAGRQEPLLSTVERRKLSWFGHNTRHNIITKTTLRGAPEGKRRRMNASNPTDLATYNMQKTDKAGVNVRMAPNDRYGYSISLEIKL